MAKLFLTVVVLLVFQSLLSSPVRAQAGAPGVTGPAPGSPPTAVPLDGGSSLLLASGVAYGLRRLKKRKQSQ